MAAAMATGSLASATPEFMRTPSAPSSMATAVSLAVPTPASTMTGTFARSTMIRTARGLRMPWPEPMGDPSGMTLAAPASSRRWARMGSSLV